MVAFTTLPPSWGDFRSFATSPRRLAGFSTRSPSPDRGISENTTQPRASPEVACHGKRKIRRSHWLRRIRAPSRYFVALGHENGCWQAQRPQGAHYAGHTCLRRQSIRGRDTPRVQPVPMRASRRRCLRGVPYESSLAPKVSLRALRSVSGNEKCPWFPRKLRGYSWGTWTRTKNKRFELVVSRDRRSSKVPRVFAEVGYAIVRAATH
jgi:hypothetical protein